MSKIKKLDQNLINKIAAGEVVERPANILKELVENSIDAHSDSISIYIEKAGIKSIQVVDNGDGMEKEDLSLAAKEHTTSKIENEEDLENIRTLGFRGEALSSICSVSKTEIISKTEESESASRLYIEGGEVKSFESFSSPKGTSIKIEDLFYNTPARRKFLKSENTEYSYLQDIINAFILSNPNIQFRIFNNGKEVSNFFKESSIENRVKKLLNISLEELLPIYSDGVVKISGFIGKAEVSRNTRDKQYIFVNNRFIQNNLIPKAVSEGYPNLLMTKKYPVFLIFLNLPGFLVDVNVHPRKSEVRFLNNNEVYISVKNTVQSSFKSVSLINHENAGKIEETDIYINSSSENLGKGDISSLHYSTKKDIDADSRQFPSRTKYPHSSQQNYEVKKALEFTAQILEHVKREEELKVKSYQYLNRYIIAEIGNEIKIIDQHAAAEMVLFEKYLDMVEKGRIEKQSFMIPIGISIVPKDSILLEDNLEILEQFGIDASMSGSNEISINALPFTIDQKEAEKFIGELIEIIKETEDLTKENIRSNFKKKIAASLACHSAVRFGDKLEQSEVDRIVKDLQQCREFTTCPHGRPIIYSLSSSELDKIFKRK